MAQLSRVGLFCFSLPEHLMPLIYIVTLQGMIQRVAGQLLPDEAVELAQDCAFDSGIITPLRDDPGLGVQLPFTPKTIFHYYGEFWFAWSGLVEEMLSPIAQDQYNQVEASFNRATKVSGELTSLTLKTHNILLCEFIVLLFLINA